MTTARRPDIRIECRSCGFEYSVRIHGGVCPLCGFDAFVELLQRLDPLGHTAKVMKRNQTDR